MVAKPFDVTKIHIQNTINNGVINSVIAVNNDIPHPYHLVNPVLFYYMATIEMLNCPQILASCAFKGDC